MLLFNSGYLLHRYILYVAIIILPPMLFSCKNAEKHRQPYENDLGIKPANLAQIDTINYTTVEWLNPVKNFGVAREGDSVLIQFGFKNTGIHPLFIYSVRPSCGCTEPQYTQKAILPGQEDKMTVYFYTKGQAGQVNKSITVTTNTSNGVRHLLSFVGRVDSLRKTGRK